MERNTTLLYAQYNIETTGGETITMAIKEYPDEYVVWDDYPISKYAKKSDWWISQEGLDLLAGWRSAGCTIKEIHLKMGVDARTLRTWRKKYPQIDEVLAIGKEVATSRIINALYRKAVGYEYEESVQELVDGEMVTTKIFKKHMPPDVKAILAYLYNREAQDWRATQQPIDVNIPAIQNAENILVKIRDVVGDTESTEDTVETTKE
jgi:lambda repressor-like predicted transcriptional regulator